MEARPQVGRNRPGALIDLHSANQYNPRDGFISSATSISSTFPISTVCGRRVFRLSGLSGRTIGLVEVSGIPFGLMGEMLQDGGNPWRAWSMA